MEWTGARYADMPTIDVSIWIDASLARVWSLVSDIAVMPTLSNELQSVEWLNGADGPAVGAQFTGGSKHPSLGEWTTTSFVTEYEAGRVFTWAVEDPGAPTALWRFTAQPADGGTTLHQWMQFGPGRSGLSDAIDAMPDKEEKIMFVRMREHEQSMQRNLAAIKSLAEQA